MTTHLLDTSVLSRLHVPGVRGRLDVIPAEDLARCTVTDLEIGFSARNTGEWDKLQSFLLTLAAVAVDDAVVHRAKVVQRALAERGLRGRKVPDLLIAAAAELSSQILLHYDADFEMIASVTGQAQDWVVGRGSID